MSYEEFREQIQVTGAELVEQVKTLMHEGNVRHIVIKHDGNTLLEIPVTFGVVGLVLAPVLAGVAAIGAMVSHCTIEVVRTEPPSSAGL